MAKIVTPAELARRLAAGEDLAAISADKAVRLVDASGSAAVAGTDDARTVSFAISTTGVKRDGLALTGDGWKLDAYLRNPVVLWSHDDMTPAIGRAVATQIVDGTLMSTAVFAERDVHPLADTVLQLIRGKFLNAASVGFIPLRARLSTDPKRQGEIDVLEQELWEWSVVNVPADPDALVAARAAGVDTQPIFQWTERMLDQGGFLIVPKAELEALRRNAKMPAPAKKRDATTKPAAVAVPVKRSLWHVANLASLLESLGWLQTDVEWEASYEEDGSTVPAQLTAAIQELGKVLVAMTQEEVAELLTKLSPESDPAAAPVALDAPTPAQRAIIALNTAARNAKSAERRYILRSSTVLTASAVEHLKRLFQDWRAGKAPLFLDPQIQLEIVDTAGIRIVPTLETRVGRVLSADNEQCLRDAHDLMTQASEKVMGIVNLAAPADDEGDGDGKIAAAAAGARERRARALRLKTPAAT